MQRLYKSRFVSIGLLAVPGLTGCGRAPSFNILGSYFPAWLLCILVGIAVASAFSFILGRVQKPYLIQWTIVTYPSIAASVAFTLWLLFFS